MMSLAVIGVISGIFFQVNLHVGFHSVPEETCENVRWCVKYEEALSCFEKNNPN